MYKTLSKINIKRPKAVESLLVRTVFMWFFLVVWVSSKDISKCEVFDLARHEILNAECDSKHSYICEPKPTKHGNNTKKSMFSRVIHMPIKVKYKFAKAFCRKMNGRLPHLNSQDVKILTELLNDKGRCYM